MKLIGELFPTKEGDVIRVESYVGKKYYMVSFLHPNTPSNYYKKVRSDSIINGLVKNPFFPSIYDNGYIGSYVGYATKTDAYKSWHRMMERCYSLKLKEKYPTYNDVYCCDEWNNFSIFYEWYIQNSINNYELDKDILIKNNKKYSPETCCFIPQELNKLLTKSNKTRGKYPLGVNYHKQTNKFVASVRHNNILISIGYYDTTEEAFNAYKTKKEEIIRESAEQYFSDGAITEEIYNALLTYEVSIDD
jgi:hypothetical protein